jgi:hypothetical protein
VTEKHPRLPPRGCACRKATAGLLLNQLDAVFLDLIDEGFVGSEHLGAERFGLDTVVNLGRQAHESQPFFIQIF